jgi:hypothetical protein
MQGRQQYGIMRVDDAEVAIRFNSMIKVMGALMAIFLVRRRLS